MSTDDPMMASMPGRYATALFELAKDQRQLDKVAADVTTFRSILAASEDLRRMLRSPVIAAADQARALGAVMTAAGISGLTANFLNLVAHNRRLFAVPEMLESFLALLARERGEVRAEVTTAHPLTQAQLDVLSDTLKAQLGTRVKVDTRVDAGLLGGLIVKVGSRMVDGSLRTKLNNLKVAMKGTH